MTSTSPLARSFDSHWFREVLRFPWKPWLRVLVLAAGLIVAAIALIRPLLPPTVASILTLVTVIVLWILTLRVASRLLLATADGAGLQREYQAFDLPERQAARQIGLWFLVLILIGGLGQLLGWLGLALGAGLALVLLPAMTLIVARENAIGKAFKPSGLKAIYGLLGLRRYRQLVMLLGGLMMAYLIADTGVSRLPLALGNGLMMAVWIYLLWVWFYALGRSLAAIRQTERSMPKPFSSEQSLDELKQRLITQGGTLEEHARLARALDLHADATGLLEHGPAHVAALLLAYERPAEAVERADHLVRLDPDFRLDLPSSQLALIRAAQDHGPADLVLKLCAAYLKTWPAAPGCAEVRAIDRQAHQQYQTRS